MRDITIYSDRGKGPKVAEAVLLNASDREAGEKIWRFRQRNRGVKFWWEPTRKGSE